MTRRPTPELDPEPIFRALIRYDVKFVVIGGYAATVHRVPVPPTTDVDVTVSRDADNLDRLVSALRHVGAKNLFPEVVGSDRPPFFDDPSVLLRRRFWSVVTRYGALDIVLAPDGFPGGYDDLVGDSRRLPALRADGTPGRLEIMVASVHHIFLSKKQAGRPKDIRALPALAQALARELRQRQEDRSSE